MSLFSRRQFASSCLAGAAASLVLGSNSAASAAVLGADPAEAPAKVPEFLRNLRPMLDGVTPVSLDERRARIEKAQRLMRENRMDAMFLESGTNLFYFTGLRWWASERLFAAIIPASGEVAYVAPGFEEGRARELIKIGNEVRVWQEDEDPAQVVAGILKDRGARYGRIGMDEYSRFIFFDKMRQAAPKLEFVSAVPITAGCRMIKSPHELALMQRANDITIEAYRAAFPTAKEGMTPQQLSANISAAFRALGVSGNGSVSFGIATSFPHGSIGRQVLREGDIILVDGGCTVEGYNSDITRSFVIGKPSQKQIDVWEVERRAQDAALRAAKPGVPCEVVDAAARKVITDAGFGPDYKLPGLPHRTGHGIGLDGHEWTNFVRGNKTLMQPGMCFSDEPMIAIPDQFGIRLEDCLHITEDGAKLFTRQAVSITQPIA